MKTVELLVEILVKIPISNKDLTDKEIIDSLNDATNVSDLLHLGVPEIIDDDISECNIANVKGSVVILNKNLDIEWIRNKRKYRW